MLGSQPVAGTWTLSFRHWPPIRLKGHDDPHQASTVVSQLTFPTSKSSLSGAALGVVVHGNGTVDFRLSQAAPRTDDGDFDFEAYGDWIAELLQVMNAYVLCLRRGIFEADGLSFPRFAVQYRDLGRRSTDGTLDFLGWRTSFQFEGPWNLHLGWSQENEISGSALRAAWSHFTKLTRDPSDVLLAALLLRAEESFDGHRYEESLLGSWPVIEQCLYRIWRDYTNHQHPEATKDQRRFWVSRDFSASVVTEVLVLAGIMDDFTGSSLAELRKARNNWIHATDRVTRATARHGIAQAHHLFARVTGTELGVPAEHATWFA